MIQASVLTYSFHCGFFHSFKEAWHSTADLRELDPALTKVMLYTWPHKELVWVFQQTDPILSTSFLIWRVENEYDSMIKDATVCTYNSYSCMFLLIIMTSQYLRGLKINCWQ